MRRRTVSIVATTVAVWAATVGLAGEASADTPPASAGNPAPWVMPNVKGLKLDKAIEAVFAVTGPVDLNIDTQDRKHNQEQLNQTNWLVCGQYPNPDKEISQKSKKVILIVKRPNEKDCV